MKHEIQNVFTVTPLPDDPPKGEINIVASIGAPETITLNKSFELFMQVAFEVRGKNLDSRQVNPLLEKFREQLKDYRLEEDGIKAWPKRVDEFEWELVGTDLLICSQNILWNIYSPRGISGGRIQIRLLRDMRKMKLEKKEDEEDSENEGISIYTTQAVFQGSQRCGRWPKDERFAGAGF